MTVCKELEPAIVIIVAVSDHGGSLCRVPVLGNETGESHTTMMARKGGLGTNQDAKQETEINELQADTWTRHEALPPTDMENEQGHWWTSNAKRRSTTLPIIHLYTRTI